MGMYPSADLHYGIDVGEWEWAADGEELPWWTEEAETEYGLVDEAANAVLEAAGLRGITLESYGDLASTYTLYILSARLIGFRAYGAKVINPEDLVVSLDDAKNLEKAWELLFGSRPHSAPAWVGTVSYG